VKSNDSALAKLRKFGNNVSRLTINEAKVFLYCAHCTSLTSMLIAINLQWSIILCYSITKPSY